RPPDVNRVATALRLPPPVRSVDDAEARMRAARIDIRPLAAPSAAAAAGAPPLVEAESVSFGYDARTPTLSDVSLTVREGEFLALIGQNGSGKTTLAKHLNGLLRARSGRVRLRGTDVSALPINRVATDVGYVFQNPDHQIFADTVYDEIAFGPRNVG